MTRSILAGLLVFSALAARSYECPKPPDPPGPDEWVFRTELSVPEEHPGSDVTVDPATGRPRTFWLENRISRCFFGPIKRPPFYRDELMSDIDYYPDAYLERLRREGVNGLWITIEFRELVETRFTPRDKNALKRYAKLNQTVEKCARHGIGVWIFAIEPSIKEDNLFFKKHPDCCGPLGWNGNRLLCTAAPESQQYLEDATCDIFTHVPGLAGFINISHGERPTTCLSGEKFTPLCDEWDYGTCPRCSKLESWQIHANTVGAMVRGIRRAGSKAPLISWFYEPERSDERRADMYACAAHLPDGVTFQYNFETGCSKVQNGKRRVGGDYWLSEPQPGAPFRKVAAASAAAGTRLSAKIQAICSHENACIPYVPVPGILYRKFKAMRELGVKDAMLCWYFGNYPGLMNRACGMLAASDFTEGEDAFLDRLAVESGWGDEAKAVARIWKALSDGYANYPLTNQMQYYGPFHFGCVWPLYPKVELHPLSPTWKPDFPPPGDAIGECLGPFTLDEAIELAEKMQVDGSDFARLKTRFAGNRERLLDLGVMETLRYQFRSALDILRFYRERDRAVKAAARGDLVAARRATAAMRALVADERRISEAMIPLCEADGRLGFHSEAEVHQFHAAKLKWRIGTLDLAVRELDEIDASLAAGKGYPKTEMDRGAPTLAVAADGTIDLNAVGGTNAVLHLTTLDETGISFPRTVCVTNSPGARWKVPADAARLCVRPADREAAPIWPQARYPFRPRLTLYSVNPRNFGRLVRPARPARRTPPAQKLDVSFARGKWNPAEFTVVKGPRWPYVLSFEQLDDAIVNPCPDVPGAEVYKKHHDKVYAAMVHTNRFSFGCTISSTMMFDHRMAPIIVIAPELGRTADGTPEFREHWEICLYDEGINVWHHFHDGKTPSWYCASAIHFQDLMRYAANTRLEVRVRLSRTDGGHKQMTVYCGDYDFSYVDDSLPDTFQVGVLGCEGRNFFYDLKVR